MRKQREVLEHQSDAAPVGRHVDARPRHDPVVDADGTAVDALDARRRPQDGRLARAGFAEEADDLAGHEIEVKTDQAPAARQARRSTSEKLRAAQS